MVVIVVVIVTVVEMDPKEIQNGLFLWGYSKVKEECPSPKQHQPAFSPESHKGHKRVPGITMAD